MNLLWVLEKVKAADERFAIFCHAGPERSGALAAILLMKDGLFPAEAIQTVRSVRPDAIEPAAEKWLLELKPDDFVGVPPGFDVTEAVKTCAYRFDTRAYLDSLHIPPFPVPHKWFGTRRWDTLDDVDKLHSCFVLQRYLRHWGGQTLPEIEVEWHIARGMFLELCRTEVPEGLRLTRYTRRWEREFAPRLDDIVRRVEREQARLPRTFRGYDDRFG